MRKCLTADCTREVIGHGWTVCRSCADRYIAAAFGPRVETPLEAIERRYLAAAEDLADSRVPIVLGDLFGPEGNAFAVMGRVQDALKQAGQLERWPAIQADMQSDDYQHLLRVVDREFRVMQLVGRQWRAYPDWLEDYEAELQARQASDD